ncbi:PAS domain-containing protein [Methylobacterium sp. NEAU K]|uniref:PAS domain-containing protein n=1 Tax=Methylobacterium sp. NEAU K TaxID=3064946 RepID=UPI0027330FCF|nr:PAS domain-containing protein [Methylobacterium sp. NEAU K]MDP4006425.1 PAS domain-containing protein [Methylobacterium sp. NEAU K]
MSCPSGFEPLHPQRLAALRSYAILDTVPEREFDEIAEMAAQACGTPMAHINFIDADRQWIKAAVGHTAREMPLASGFCTEALRADGVLVLPDLAAEPDRAANVLVAGEPHLRFYAGVALVTPDGWTIGTLCVLDREPRTLTEQQLFILKALARTVMTQLESRCAEAALRRTEERYRSLFEFIEAGFCLIELKFEGGERAVDYRYLEVNPAFERQTGLRDVVGKWMRDLAPDHEQHWFDIYGRVARTGEPARFEEAAASLGRWYDVHAYRVDGPVRNRVAILFNDITDRRRSELALRAREAELRLVADAMPVLIAVIDSKGIYQFANAAYETWTGRSPADVVGRSMIDLLGPEAFEARRSAIEQALAGHEVRTELTWKGPDGEAWIADTRYLPRRAADGRVEGFYVFAHDVSDRKGVEALLQSRADSLEAQVAAQTRDRDRVWTLSPVLKFVAAKDGRIHSVNPSWSRALGWSEAETLGRAALDFVAAPERDAALTALRPLWEGRRVEDVELACTTRAGDSRRVLWTVVPEDRLFYGFGRDITEQRQAEDALRQSQKLEAIGQLTGGVAHDFNNLLTIIRSSVEFLRRPELAEERRRRYLDAVSDTVDRAAKLTGQLLAFARRQALKPQVFDICERLRSIADMLDSLTGARIHVGTDLPDTACFVRADESQFETALINMAVNARDAMGGEGRLTLRLDGGRPMPAIRGHAGAPGPFVAVRVVDTGTGIPAPDLGRIFEPFFTTKEIGKGTGLGLSQVIGFAKQSGGDIDVASVPGHGTTFTLYLPQVEAPSEAADAGRDDRREAEPQRGLCILVVEDNLEVGRFCTQILEDLGHAPIWAKSAEEALGELERTPNRFDAVFSDVVMPGIGGVALARRLQINRPDLPVVLTSGYSHILAKDDTHGFALVRKPYSAEQLAQVLYDATKRRTPPSSGAAPSAAKPVSASGLSRHE